MCRCVRQGIPGIADSACSVSVFVDLGIQEGVGGDQVPAFGDPPAHIELDPLAARLADLVDKTLSARNRRSDVAFGQVKEREVRTDLPIEPFSLEANFILLSFLGITERAIG